MADPTNSEIALALDELGDLYELDGAIVHRIVAYRNAAKAVRDAPVSVSALARDGCSRSSRSTRWSRCERPPSNSESEPSKGLGPRPRRASWSPWTRTQRRCRRAATEA